MKNIFTTVALILCTSYLSKAQDQVYLELPQGWSMFGYVSTEDTDVIEAFSEISTDIEIVKDGWGMAYIPDWGFNGLGNLEYARGYQIKMINQVDDFQFESVITSSMDNNEALIALEELLFNLQENMIVLQDAIITSEEIEWNNHMMQEGQIMDLQNDMVSMNTYQDEQINMLQSVMSDMDASLHEQNMMQDEQIMMLQEEVESLQNQLATVLSLCEDLQSQINTLLPVAVNIGDFHEGGIVFYIDDTGEHGLVAATSDPVNANFFNSIDIAEDYVAEGFDDWYLPNIEELQEMYLTNVLLGNSGGFQDDFYYSSSVSQTEMFYAQGVDFASGVIAEVHFDNLANAVFIRAF